MSADVVDAEDVDALLEALDDVGVEEDALSATDIEGTDEVEAELDCRTVESIVEVGLEEVEESVEESVVEAGLEFDRWCERRQNRSWCRAILELLGDQLQRGDGHSRVVGLQAGACVADE